MNRDSIELRIDELEHRKQGLINKAREIKELLTKNQGAIDECWEWLEAWKERGEYGYKTLEDGVRVMQVPKFRTQEEIAQALTGQPKAIEGEDPEEAKSARVARARKDAQLAADVMDGKSPHE